MVDFPEAERPVNQTVQPACLRRVLRSERESEGCQVMLLEGAVSLCFAERLGEERLLREHQLERNSRDKTHVAIVKVVVCI